MGPAATRRYRLPARQKVSSASRPAWRDADVRPSHPDALGDVGRRACTHRLWQTVRSGQHLIGEGSGHHEGRMARRITEVQPGGLPKQDHAVALRELDHVYLWLDVGPLEIAQRCDLNLVIEVADIADNRHILHLAHMLDADHVLVAGGGDENVCRGDDIFHLHHFKTVHRRLQCAGSGRPPLP